MWFNITFIAWREKGREESSYFNASICLFAHSMAPFKSFFSIYSEIFLIN